MFQNFTASMGSGTIGGMKILAVKNVGPFANLRAVRYTRLTARGHTQDAYFRGYLDLSLRSL
jgi:hypothetical protein